MCVWVCVRVNLINNCAKTPHSCFLVFDVSISGVRRRYHPTAQILNQNILDFITPSEKKKVLHFYLFSEKKIRYFYLNRMQENVSKLFYFAIKKPKSTQTEPQGTPSVFVRLFVCFF